MDHCQKEIDLLTRCLILADDQLQQIQSLLMNSFNDGLKRETNPVAPVKMFPTFVREVPDEKNKYVEGKFLALDLGGTNFRVLLIELVGDELHHETEIYTIADELRNGTGEKLFDYIAECIFLFLDKRNLVEFRMPLGFTFSFPCKQEGLNSARLTTWTKGFKCTGVEGEDVVKLLREAIDRRNDIEVEVMAIVNDTTGTMVSCALQNKECRVGLIVGTGTNACYMETIENVELYNEDITDVNQVVVNTELGAFGDNNVLNFARTRWDHTVDQLSAEPGKQIFEKMVSGMYLGEIVRCILCELTQRRLVFGGKGSVQLMTPKGFKTAYISAIESDSKDDYLYTRQVMAEIGLRHATQSDYDMVKLICSRISTRAAHLVSAAVSTILNKMQRPYTTVAVDGSVYKFHPHFHQLLEEKTLQLVKPEIKFDIKLSEDGSGRGAALVAAVATKQDIQRKISTGNRLAFEPVNRKNSRMELKQFLKSCKETF